MCLDSQGKLLFADTIYPLEPHNKISDSEKTLEKLCEKFKVGAIAVGNGTGGREAKKRCRRRNSHRPILLGESGKSLLR